MMVMMLAGRRRGRGFVIRTVESVSFEYDPRAFTDQAFHMTFTLFIRTDLDGVFRHSLKELKLLSAFLTNVFVCRHNVRWGSYDPRTLTILSQIPDGRKILNRKQKIIL